MRAADHDGSPARMLAGIVFKLVWWLPTILLIVAALAARAAWWQIRMERVRMLRRMGRLDAAVAALERLADEEARWRP